MNATLRTLSVIAVGLLLASPARAQDRSPTGFYAVGHLKFDLTTARIAVDGQRRASTSVERDPGVRLGYRQRVGRSRLFVGLEAGVDASDTIEGRTLITGPRGVNFSFEKRGVTTVVDGLAGLDVHPRLSVFVTVGYATAPFSRGAFAFDVGQPPPPEIVTNDRLHALTVGGGVETRLAPRMTLRIAATRERSTAFAAEDFGLAPQDFNAAAAEAIHAATQVKLGVVVEF